MEATLDHDRPDICRYLEYREFLRDFFDWLGARDRKRSRRWIALRAGLKSPQLISMILKGDRKLSFENAQLLSLAMGLSPKETEYLVVLVELENASQREKQLEILDRIRAQFQNGFFKDLSDEGYEYIKKWHYPAARELAALKRFPMRPEAIARALDIDESDARDSLDELVRLGFLRRREDGGFERDDPSVHAADSGSPLVMMQYHLQALERAFQATQLRRELRHLECLTVALSSRDVPAVRDKIRQLAREIDMIGETSARRDDVYQLSVQFFSLTGGRAPLMQTGENK